MALYVGDTKIKRVYHGDTPIKRIYYGDTLVWAALGVASGLSSTRNNTSFTPAWAAVEDADSYDLRWSTNSDMTGATTVTGTTSGTAVTGLSALTTYYWEVRANEGDIVGDWSATQNVTTTGALSGLSSTRTRTSFTPSWNAITGLAYDMRWSTNSDMTGATTVTGTTSGTAVTGLNTSTTYYWEVRSKRGSTLGEWSSTQSVTTQAALTVPARGAAPSASGGNQRVDWTATAPNNGGSAITHYLWRWREVGAVSWRTTVTTTARTFARTGLTANTQYEAQFKARNTIGDAASWSPSGRATTDAVVQLPVAVAASVTINAIPSGNEGTTYRLTRTLTGGRYDEVTAHAWVVAEGTLDDASAVSPTWTRPAVSATKNVAVDLAVGFRGTGTNARAGTTASAAAPTVQAQVVNAGESQTIGSPSSVASLAAGTGGRWASLTWNNPAPLITNNVINGGQTRRLFRCSLLANYENTQTFAREYQILLDIKQGTADENNRDLSAAFEAGWELSVRVGSSTWTFNHDDFTSDTTEPYQWLTTDTTARSNLLAAADAMIAIAGANPDIAVTLAIP